MAWHNFRIPKLGLRPIDPTALEVMLTDSQARLPGRDRPEPTVRAVFLGRPAFGGDAPWRYTELERSASTFATNSFVSGRRPRFRTAAGPWYQAATARRSLPRNSC